MYKGDQQIGFARVITDYATFAWIADVFILDAFQGQGLGNWLMEVIIAHPELQGFQAMGACDERRSRVVSQVWIQRIEASGAMDGKTRPEYAGETGLLD